MSGPTTSPTAITYGASLFGALLQLGSGVAGVWLNDWRWPVTGLAAFVALILVAAAVDIALQRRAYRSISRYIR